MFPVPIKILKYLSIVGFGVTFPLTAVAERVAVLRSQENADRWNEITARLQAVGVDYCTLDSKNWSDAKDLQQFRVILLPNVENINGSQVVSLARWMGKGGKVIATGPTGSLSEPAVQNQLKTLFGAYWGFANSRVFTIKPTDIGEFQNRKPLAGSLIGGVVIPTGVNSQTVAVWGSQGNPPAAVITSNSTFLGWRWGTDAVSPPAVDTAWLEKSLKRYGIDTGKSRGTGGGNCQQTVTAFNPLAPAGRRQPETAPLNPIEPTAPAPARVSIKESDRLSEELKDLIGRYETNLLASLANGNGTIDKALEGGKNENAERFRRSVEAVRAKLEEFQRMIKNGDSRARDFWLDARRAIWDGYTASPVVPQPEVRAMWLDRGTIVKTRSEAELAKVFDRMRAAGVNVVFFETVNAGYTIYPSRVAPEQNPLTRGWDPLKAAVKLARERGMELHAWVWAFAAANQGHNKVIGKPINYLGPVLSRNPDWGATNRNGGAFDYGRENKKAFFDPANPDVQDYLVALYSEIVRNYDVDGVQLDYIRYPFQEPRTNETYGYGKSSRWLFKQQTGTDPVDITPGSSLWEQWTTFRIRQIDTFVSRVSRELKQIRPDVTLSVAVFPLERTERLRRIQQNWEEWGRNRWVDMVFLMTYALDTGTLEDKTRFIQERDSAGSSLVIPGIRLLKVPDPVTIDQMQYVRDLPTAGYALFATENLNPGLESLLNRLQGSSPDRSSQPLPHRQPFTVVYQRFQSLRREWDFLLSNNILTLDEGGLKTWQSETASVARQLQQLEREPTYRNFTLARNSLKRFNDRFNDFTRSQTNLSPYRKQVWTNRLETLQRLLSYGERSRLKN